MLLYTTGVALSEILTTVFFAWVGVVCGLVGALVPTSYKWGFYAFSIAAMFYIWWILLGHGTRTRFNAGGVVRSDYLFGAGWLSILLPIYAITWALCEGANRISPTREMVWYGILDLLLGPLFLYCWLVGLSGVDYNLFGLHSGKFTDGQGAYGTYGSRGEDGVRTGAPVPKMDQPGVAPPARV